MDATGPNGEFEPMFRLRKGPRQDLVLEEIDLLRRISDAVTEKTSLDATPRERREAAAAMHREDPEVGALMDRLAELARGNDESVALGLAKLGIEEEEEEQEEEEREAE